MSTVAGTGRKDGRSRAGFLLDIALFIFLFAVAYVIVLQRLGVTERGMPGAGAPVVACISSKRGFIVNGLLTRVD